jgi:hypothetical protein
MSQLKPKEEHTMPTIQVEDVQVRELRRGDEVRLPRAEVYSTVTNIVTLTKNVDVMLNTNGVGGSVRWAPDRVVTVRRSLPTREEARQKLIERLDNAVTSWLPEEYALDALRNEAAEAIAKHGPSYYLTCYSVEFAEREHDLLMREALVKHTESEDKGSLDPVFVAEVIITRVDELQKELLYYYGWRSSSMGSNLADEAKFNATRKLLNHYTTQHVRYLLEQLREHDAETTAMNLVSLEEAVKK